MASQAAAPPAEAARTATRKYGVFTELKLDLTDPVKLVEELQKFGDGKVVVLARVGEQTATDPRQAIKKFGADNDLDGDYEAIADTSRTKFPKLKTANKRTVQGL